MSEGIKRIPVQAFDHVQRKFRPRTLCLSGDTIAEICGEPADATTLYMSPGFIDSHAHVYPGATDLGIDAERIGLRTGVHLIADAGSAGSNTMGCLRDYVLPTYQTEVRAFLNISRVGLVTKYPYHDTRDLDVDAAVKCALSGQAGLILGIKVLSSGLIVEEQGMLPIRMAVEAAERIGCRVMAHLAEGPPSNEETMALLRPGDIITHCFHGAPNIDAALAASKGVPVNPKFCSLPNIMWNAGSPSKPLEDALSRGVLLDVGHGAASLDQTVAKAAVAAGLREFSISTDAHIRNLDGVVQSLPWTMSKFLAFGMRLDEVTASVTVIPASQLGLAGWCDDMAARATLFRLRPVRQEDPPFLDANKTVIDASQVIEPVALIRAGRLVALTQDWASG